MTAPNPAALAALAREAMALAEKAVRSPYGPPDITLADGRNSAFFSHAASHYATLASALLERAGQEREAIKRMAQAVVAEYGWDLIDDFHSLGTAALNSEMESLASDIAAVLARAAQESPK